MNRPLPITPSLKVFLIVLEYEGKKMRWPCGPHKKFWNQDFALQGGCVH